MWYPAAVSPVEAGSRLADHSHALSSLYPPPAALASLPNSTTSAYSVVSSSAWDDANCLRRFFILSWLLPLVNRNRLSGIVLCTRCIQKVCQPTGFALDIPEYGLYNRFGIVYAVRSIDTGFSVSLITGVKPGVTRFTPYGVLLDMNWVRPGFFSCTN